MKGKTLAQAEEELKADKMPEETKKRILPHKVVIQSSQTYSLGPSIAGLLFPF